LDRKDGHRYWEKDENGPPRRLEMLAQKVKRSCHQDGGKGIDQHRGAE